MILAISSSSTTSDINFSFSLDEVIAFNFFSNSGIIRYCNSPAFSYSPLEKATSKSKRDFSSCSLIFLALIMSCFSTCHLSSKTFSLSFKSLSSLFKSSNLFLDESSFSLLNADFSISNCLIFLVNSSSSCGIDSTSTLIEAQASSTRSIALSGRNLDVKYLFDKVAAATRALSVIETPWNDSNRFFNPLKIDIVSSTVGSFTKTGWNLLSKARSFSIYSRYSFNVVAPIQSISPLASIGLSILLASRAPSLLPAPTIRCISSINKIILPSLSLILFKTAFNLSSNSPRYFAPATKAPISSS